MYSSPMPGTLDVKGTLTPNSCITELKKGKSKLSCEGLSFNLNAVSYTHLRAHET